MVIIFDKDVDSNIDSIESSGIAGNIFYWQSETANGWLIDKDNFKIRIGGDDVNINFGSLESMEIYISQFLALDQGRNPIVDGINNDPHYDLPKTGTIQSHTYVDTDIEKDLINGDS